MARKKRRHTNIPEEALNRARREAGGFTNNIQVVTESPKPQKKSNMPESSPALAQKTTMEDLATEYAYVLTDLRNMGMLAATLFAVLVILSFIL
jgi:hypothetical protein